MTPRQGAALVLALLAVIVIEIAVLGVVQLALQERRIAQNAVAALRLRVSAEAAARAAAAHWDAGLDSLASGQHRLTTGAFDTTALQQRITWQAAEAGLILVTAELTEPPPDHGRARAAVLVRPPLLPPYRVPAAALATPGPVQVLPGGELAVALDPSCPLPAGAAALVPDTTHVHVDPLAALSGGVVAQPFDLAWSARLQNIRLAADTALRVLASPFTGTADGVLLVDGDLVLRAGAVVTGLLLINGTLRVESGATVHGAVVATGDVAVSGSLLHSACAVDAALRMTPLHRPRPHALRPVIPAF